MMWKECGRVRSSYGRPSIQREGDLLSRYTAGQMNAVASGILGAHDLSVALRSLATYLCLSLLFLCVSVLSLPSQSLPPCISALYLFHVSACICSASTQFGISGWQLANSDPVLAPFDPYFSPDYPNWLP